MLIITVPDALLQFHVYCITILSLSFSNNQTARNITPPFMYLQYLVSIHTTCKIINIILQLIQFTLKIVLLLFSLVSEQFLMFVTLKTQYKVHER